MPIIRMIDGPMADTQVDDMSPPEGYVIVQPEGELAAPLDARWIPMEARERYLQLGAQLLDFVAEQDLDPSPFAIYLNTYRSTPSVEPGYDYFGTLDRFDRDGHL
jgi:hypothetical protein